MTTLVIVCFIAGIVLGIVLGLAVWGGYELITHYFTVQRPLKLK